MKWTFSLIVGVSLLFLSACANQKIVLPPETFQQHLTQECEPDLAKLGGRDGGSILVTMQQWNESYRRCEALNNSKAQYMLKLQELFKTYPKLIKY